MNPTPRQFPTRGVTPRHAPPPQIYNIIPIHDLLTDHPSLRYPEVRAAAAALRTVGELPKPPLAAENPNLDLLDWLAAFFGFQRDNVRNQREHLVLHLANAQMRLDPAPPSPGVLDASVLRRFRRNLLSNYTTWCSYLGRKPYVRLRHRSADENLRRELLYVSLYLLIWGESANLRFAPECLCYIFHHMAMELNRIIDCEIDEFTGRNFLPSLSGDCSFLKSIVMPICETIKLEVEDCRNGKAPHSAWRNYDDINEYFWSSRCFQRLKWPISLDCNFFATTEKAKRVGKTGFVEQRSFWNLFRSFDKLWVLLILFFQASLIVAWDGSEFPWKSLSRRDVQVELLTVFITWPVLRLLQSILDAGTQYSLVTRDTKLIGVRMVLKSLVASGWIVIFSVLYAMIWIQHNSDDAWSGEANRRIVTFLQGVFVFVIPELLALVLFLLPWIRNWIEELDWSVLYVLTWWFHTRLFVGRGLREGLIDNVKSTLFWISVLASKFTFSYFLQIKPLVAPTKALLGLKGVEYNWHEFFNGTNRTAVVLLWIPVVLIYLMDLQIWYSIFASLTGALIGLFSHLGEIRNIEQLRLRFPFFASALQFNIMPEERMQSTNAPLVKKLRDVIHRFKLRYGLGKPYDRIESSQVEATRFALIWNEIIITFREEDIISDRELELLELPPNYWNVRVLRWPCILLCNELLMALSQANELADAPDRFLWLKICKNEYRRCVVVEAYDSVKFLLLIVVTYGTVENAIVRKFFSEMDHCIQFEKFTATYNMNLLQQIHRKLVSFVELLMKPERDHTKAVNLLQALYELSVREFPKTKKSAEQLKQNGLAPSGVSTDSELLFVSAVEFPDPNDAILYRRIKRLHTILTSRDPMYNVPKNIEARRRIAFFSNSLFMNMPHAPLVEKMMSFSVLTPYYDEEVMYGKEMLRRENEDGISTLFYLQKIYDDEWTNFLERMRREGMEDEDEIWNKKARDLRLWASYRGQTLSRTVRGMMYYYKAVKMLAFLDSASEMDIRQGSHNLPSLGRAESGLRLLFRGHEYVSALIKFTYVVTCQVYGKHKAKGDHRADEILYLMKTNEALRIAYVDEVYLGRDEIEYYSVLVKYDHQQESEVEVYRIRLPGPLQLGEGKAENQNHALIFTRGDAVQTIDMNQDNYFEEALKMRNLLEEFKTYYGIRKPTVLGLRENIFTGSVSSLAKFKSAQETSFVTLGQRVLSNPLKIRMHYGHPDVFDRFWFITRGGLSKASRVINMSEDIFAGYNCTLRGGNVTHHEHIQVGKGRDVGFNQISTFEAKLASGNGEQASSRDVYRLGHRLDYFRMLSFFYTTVGFSFNSMLVVMSVFTFLWGRLYLSLSGVEDAAMNHSSNNEALGTILTQQFLIQIGFFTTLPMVVENTLEHGFLHAAWDYLTMQFQLASIFYTFSIGTRTHYFGRTILHGCTKYRATGRGFVVQHKTFAENYRLYARSHFIKGVELGVILIVYASQSPLAKNTFVYIAMTFSSWFLVVSWIMAPFIFNPSGFDWLKTVYDFDEFVNWVWNKGGVFAKAEESWETWWYEEQDHLRATGLWGKLLEIVLNLRFFFFQYGIVYQLHITGGSTSIGVYLLSWTFMAAAVGIYVTIAYARDKYAATEHIYYRLVQLLVIAVTVLVVFVLLEFTDFVVTDLVGSLLAFVPTGWGLISIALVIRPFLQSTVAWDTVVSLARVYDMLIGVVVMAPVALLSWLPGFQAMQTRILFNEAFSRGLQISRLVTGKKFN